MTNPIADIDAYQVFDSRGNPTVEATVTLADGTVGRGIVPSGASTGIHEALELRDQDPTRFRGKSVYQAIGNIRGIIRRALVRSDSVDQRAVDEQMIALDGTENKSRLGANAILAVSLAYCQAVANARGIPLFEHLGDADRMSIPLPQIQLVGGGAHAARSIDVQDFMLVAVGAESFSKALETTFHVYRELEVILRERHQLFGVADEGGFWPAVSSNIEVLDLVVSAIERAGYVPGKEAAIAIDFAASDLYRGGQYHLASEQRAYSSGEFIELVCRWVRDYPICSIEDPLDQDDWEGWQAIMSALGRKVQIIGDDLFTTNMARIRRGMERRAANAVLIKLNQIGTLTETMDAIALTQQLGWQPVISARSGETEDGFISHLAVATGAGQLKVGSFARGERMAKWNEVLRIERRLGAAARFRGASVLPS